MKILLLGEYSKVHSNLAEGLKYLGHQVVIASDGDSFKEYDRDIDLTKQIKSYPNKRIDIFKNYKFIVTKIHGFDIVQLINPLFIQDYPHRLNNFAKIIKKFNHKLFLGCFGDDYFWVNACKNGTFKYSPLSIPKEQQTEIHFGLADYILQEDTKKLSLYITENSNGLIAGIYEYYASYQHDYSQKLIHIPFPIISPSNVSPIKINQNEKINILLGKQKERIKWKGADIIESTLRELEAKYKNDISLKIVESVPYKEYIKILGETHILADQLYSYSLSMNPLSAMSLGKVVMGGAEEESYNILNEQTLRPAFNITNRESIIKIIEEILQNKKILEEKSIEGISFINKHHNHIEVAQQYLDFWAKM